MPKPPRLHGWLLVFVAAALVLVLGLFRHGAPLDTLETSVASPLQVDDPLAPPLAPPSPRSFVALVDTDNDFLPDIHEDINQNGRVDPCEADPHKADTDGDGLLDGLEDLDRDGRLDVGETSATIADTDRDGINDGDERAAGHDPRVAERPASFVGASTKDLSRGYRCGPKPDCAEHADDPEIPEPMVFDLVRGLGAKRGEFEVNALLMPRFGRNGFTEIAWAPEVEYAFSDGYAVELELPFTDTHLHAVKVALQGTVGTAWDRRLIHGWQVFTEVMPQENAVGFSGVYIAGMQISRPVSALVMAGARTHVGEKHTEAEAILNPSVFAHVHPCVVLGLETNFAVGAPSGPYARLMPQVHLGLGERAKVQLGAGLEVQRSGIHPSVGARAILEL